MEDFMKCCQLLNKEKMVKEMHLFASDFFFFALFYFHYWYIILIRILIIPICLILLSSNFNSHFIYSFFFSFFFFLESSVSSAFISNGLDKVVFQNAYSWMYLRLTSMEYNMFLKPNFATTFLTIIFQ